MKYASYIVLLGAALAIIVLASLSAQPLNQSNIMSQSTMKLASPAFSQGGSIPAKYTCDADAVATGSVAVHPPLSFEEVPHEAKSLVLIMEDPDVSKDRLPSGVFDHWVVFNIPPKTAGVAEGSEIAGTYGSNGAGRTAYAGPCPPDREHRYFFRLYALDTQLALKKGATKDQVLEAMDGHIIAQAELMAKYARPGQPKQQ